MTRVNLELIPNEIVRSFNLIIFVILSLKNISVECSRCLLLNCLFVYINVMHAGVCQYGITLQHPRCVILRGTLVDKLINTADSYNWVS